MALSAEKATGWTHLRSVFEKYPMIIDTIKCTQCKAPLHLGGNKHRCRQLICQYCATVMDTRNDFKALYAFNHIQPNNVELSIGTSLSISNSVFSICGYIIYTQRKQEWIHYLLYSQTHGYAQLLYKNQAFIFLRRTFHLPNNNVWLMKKGQSVMIRGEQYTIASYAHSVVYHAAGHLIDHIKPNQRIKQCFAQSGNQWFYSLYRKNAVENYHGREISL